MVEFVSYTARLMKGPNARPALSVPFTRPTVQGNIAVLLQRPPFLVAKNLAEEAFAPSGDVTYETRV